MIGPDLKNHNNNTTKSSKPSQKPPPSPSSKDIERLVGDGIRIKKSSNTADLRIEGDGCHVSLITNFGSVRVMGDGGCVQIIRNHGRVEYIGDGGRIVLGPESSNTRDNVIYKGDGGCVKIGDSNVSSSRTGSIRIGKMEKDKRTAVINTTTRLRKNEKVVTTNVTMTSDVIRNNVNAKEEAKKGKKNKFCEFLRISLNGIFVKMDTSGIKVDTNGIRVQSSFRSK